MQDPVVIISAARTPMGGFMGDFAELSANDLGGAAIKAAVERAGIAPEKVEEVLFEQPVDDEHMEGLCGPYLRVVVSGTAELANTIAKVKITGVKEDFLLGELK